MSATPAPPAGSNESITVVVRCRPMNRKETEDKRLNVVDIDTEARQVSIRSLTAGEDPKSFTFDAAYDENTQQRIFYEESCFSIIECALEGFNATIFAYGQTGCGKSFTMQGPSTTDEEMRGVIPNSFYHIFQFVKSTKDVEFLIRCSYLELYNEEIRDLLGNQKTPAKCELKEDPGKGVYVKGLSDVVVESPDDLVKMFDRGLTNRTTAATNMNAESSRSHSVFSVVIEMSTKDAMTGKDMLRVGKLNLVDLAGSERAKKTGAKDQTLKEGIKINLSLAALGNVISALSEGGRHIPYRDSKLTRLLQDSLGGNAKTMMVAAISPADYNHEETISTLRYANRAKNIKNKPKINEDPKDTMIREFKAEIERLKALLMQQQTGGAGAGDILAQLSGAMAGAMAVASNSNSAAETQESNSPKTNRNMATPQKQATKSAKSPPKQVDQTDEESEQRGTDPFAVETRADMTETTYTNYENEDFEVSQSEHNSPAKPHQPPQQQQQQLSNTRSSDDGGYADNDFDEGDDVAAAAEIRDEIEQRIHQLEHMLVHNTDDTGTSAPSTHPSSSNAPDATKGGSNKTAGTASSSEATAATTSAAEVKTELSAADQAKEAEALRLYKERKQKAKLKRDEKQKREMQRILDEKKAMEEELEELRSSTAQNNQNAPLTVQADDNSGNNNNTAAMYDKKLQKLRKKYEKKVTALKEELDEVREDFSYQRKQLMDAVVEQEKDTKLYELLCKALLGEKELQKLLDKARYDEDADEWILPYVKRKNLDYDSNNNGNSISNGGGNSGNQYPGSMMSSRVGSGQGPANHPTGGMGSKLLPDIVPMGKASLNTSNNNNNSFNPGQLQQLQPHPPTVTAGKGKKRSSNGSGAHGKGKVPLLTLPGALVSAAALTNNDEDDGDTYPDAFKHVNNPQFSHQQHVPMYSSRSEIGHENNTGNNNAGNNSSRGHQQQQSLSLPGINAHGNNSSNNSSHGNVQQQAQLNEDEVVGGKRKKAKGGALKRSSQEDPSGDEYQSGNSSNNASYHGKMPAIGSNPMAAGIADSHSYGGGGSDATLRMDQAGSGQHAGPVDEWGFQVNKRSSAAGGGGGGANEPWSDVGAHESYADYFDEDNSPELEYSDDEDFVSSAANKKKSTDAGDYSKGGPKKKKKKKAQQRQMRNSRDGLVDGDFSLGSGGGGGLPPITNATPRQQLLGGGGLSLPPI